MATAQPLTARHGDTWESPRWAISIGGGPTDLTQWHIRAQARVTSEAEEIVFGWETGDPTLVLGTAEVRLANGTQITTGTIQLRLRPRDWEGKPRRWTGSLEVEIASDATDAPVDRRTVVPARKFSVSPDTARG